MTMNLKPKARMAQVNLSVSKQRSSWSFQDYAPEFVKENVAHGTHSAKIHVYVQLKTVKPAKGEGKKRKKKRKKTYSIYIYKVLKQVHPDTGVSSKHTSPRPFSRPFLPKKIT